MIYTSYFARLKKIPDTICPIAICGKSPDWYNGLEYKKLAPKWSFFSEWKKNQDNDYYYRHFLKEVLAPLNPHTVIEELQAMAGGKDVVLLCYETSDKFCHRHIVRSWLRQHGIKSEEFDAYKIFCNS